MAHDDERFSEVAHGHGHDERGRLYGVTWYRSRTRPRLGFRDDPAGRTWQVDGADVADRAAAEAALVEAPALDGDEAAMLALIGHEPRGDDALVEGEGWDDAFAVLLRLVDKGLVGYGPPGLVSRLSDEGAPPLPETVTFAVTLADVSEALDGRPDDAAWCLRAVAHAIPEASLDPAWAAAFAASRKILRRDDERGRAMAFSLSRTFGRDGTRDVTVATAEASASAEGRAALRFLVANAAPAAGRVPTMPPAAGLVAILVTRRDLDEDAPATDAVLDDGIVGGYLRAHAIRGAVAQAVVGSDGTPTGECRRDRDGMRHLLDAFGEGPVATLTIERARVPASHRHWVAELEGASRARRAWLDGATATEPATPGRAAGDVRVMVTEAELRLALSAYAISGTNPLRGRAENLRRLMPAVAQPIFDARHARTGAVARGRAGVGALVAGFGTSARRGLWIDSALAEGLDSASGNLLRHMAGTSREPAPDVGRARRDLRPERARRTA